MLRGPHRNHTPPFKTKVVLVAVHREQTVAELAQQFDVQATGTLETKTAPLAKKLQAS